MRREGTTIGQFRIERLLGHGGMGTVYVAVDEMTGREVAVKLLRPDLIYDAGFVDRFKAEARTLARLDHPRIARLHGFFRQDDDLLMVMEFVRGTTLAELLRSAGPIAPETAVTWVLDVLEALHYAHRMGIVHRDIKPANIIIEEETGRARLTDFGIARSEAEGRLTQTGQTVGTIAYMAPEQLTTTEADGRADLYAIAVVLFELLTGSIPYTSTTTFTLMREVAEGVPSEAIDRIPEPAAALRDVLRRALASSPDDRFPDGRTFAAALRAVWFGDVAPPDDERSTTAATIVAQPVVTPQAPRSRQNVVLVGAALVIFLVGLVAVWAVVRMWSHQAPESTVATTSVSQSTDVPPAPETPPPDSPEDVAAGDAGLPAGSESADTPPPSTPAKAPAAAASGPASAGRSQRAPSEVAGQSSSGGDTGPGARAAAAVPSSGASEPPTTASRTAADPAAPVAADPPPTVQTGPPTEFGRALLITEVTRDGETETEELDVVLRFDGQRMLVLNAETRLPVTRVAYNAIGYATYTPQNTRIRLFRGIAHWLHVQTGAGHVVLRLDKRNVTEIIEELERRTGKRVHRAETR